MNADRAKREVALVSTTFDNQWIVELYVGFSRWLHQKQPISPGFLKALRFHQGLFEQLDKNYKAQPDITEISLLEIIGTAQLRKFSLAAKFLQESLGLQLSAESKLEHTEHARFERMIAAAGDRPWFWMVNDYVSYLRDTELPIRTVRLYVAAAISFCTFADMDAATWPEELLIRFLKKKPGSAASLFRFIGHCRTAYNVNVTMPARSRWKKRSHRLHVVTQLRSLFKKIDDEGIDALTRLDLARIIAKSLSITIKAALALDKPPHVEEISGEYSVLSNGRWIRVPRQLAPLAQRLAGLSVTVR